MTKVTISGDLPLWFLPQAKKIVQVFNEILQEDLNVCFDSKGNMYLMTDDELKLKPSLVEVQNDA